jgi:hypothetical protein
MDTGIIMDQRIGREETALIRAKYKLVRVVFTGGHTTVESIKAY